MIGGLALGAVLLAVAIVGLAFYVLLGKDICRRRTSDTSKLDKKEEA